MEDIKPPAPPTNTPGQVFGPTPQQPTVPTPTPAQPVPAQPVPQQAPAAPQPMSDNPVPVEATGQVTSSVTPPSPSPEALFASDTPLQPANKKSRKPLMIGILVAVLLLISAAAYFGLKMMNDKKDKPVVGGANVPTSKVVTDLAIQGPATLDPAKWKRVNTADSNELSYELVGTKCTLLFKELNNLKASKITNINQVMDSGIAYLSTTYAKSSTDYANVPAESVKLPAASGTDTFTFLAKSLTFKAAAIKAEVLAYYSGDFALVAYPVCPTDQFETNFVPTILPFIKTFKVDATF